MDTLELVKRLTIRALVSDEVFMGILVLKGGNALNVAYDITSRGSIDIDFSIEDDFTAKERKRLERQAGKLLNSEFSKHGLEVFDAELVEKPKKIAEQSKDFWGGYSLYFKIIDWGSAERFTDDVEKKRRNAIVIGRKNSKKFQVDISKYEYLGKKKLVDLEGATVNVYSPEMIVLEKLRALCQQVPEYKEIVKHITSKSRSRDYYDIYNVDQYFKIDFDSKENILLAKEIFKAKRVPVDFIKLLDDQRELHRESWESVKQTIGQEEEIFEFDHYFDYVNKKFLFLIDH
ncbi:MAG: nucleotidyl transferase AbiEii/AbiGii toxin family protein [Bacteroidales bacterium]|nr:nucleotidyl transferase AbiEii/AbiGii toxin family protein [Bacteroidales bacterium]MCF8350549.1 nucleotidyl transferase AbiEii/AbiGii toxin family protein [Bacteroidales bacterium]MCF8376596.1 nucleotidyl transferase AbiEii/AbiGii toxin family protein [Bacteroidales bacterium]MCF8401181.1 nucleotidyl transferase AbiEii/AbiGii toxin family protein [Bacteroidales bacterium]